jgi:hypothetical protein
MSNEVKSRLKNEADELVSMAIALIKLLGARKQNDGTGDSKSAQ